MDFVLRGESFKAKDQVSTILMGRVASAMQRGEAMRILGAWYDFVMAVVLPEERQRFENFYTDNDITQTELDEAIGAYMQAVSGRPLEQPSASAAGSTSTGQSVRVVSLTPATDPGEDISETEPELPETAQMPSTRSLLAGRREAS